MQPWPLAQSASSSLDEQRFQQAISSAQLCAPVSYLAPDTPHPFRPRQSSSGFRSDRVLCLLRVPSLSVVNSRPHRYSLEFLVFLLRFDQDGNVCIGILPQREEILILLARFHRV